MTQMQTSSVQTEQPPPPHYQTDTPRECGKRCQSSTLKHQNKVGQEQTAAKMHNQRRLLLPPPPTFISERACLQKTRREDRGNATSWAKQLTVLAKSVEAMKASAFCCLSASDSSVGSDTPGRGPNRRMVHAQRSAYNVELRRTRKGSRVCVRERERERERRVAKDQESRRRLATRLRVYTHRGR
jgi:hypothetical protein